MAELKLQADSGGGTSSFKGPASSGATPSWRLPSADGSAGQVLQTDGSGTLSWVNQTAAYTAPASRHFYAYRNNGSNQTITSNTNTKVEWDTAIQSNSAFSTTNNKWTATADDAGTWFVQLQLSYYTDGDDGSDIMTQLYKNGAAYSGGYTWIWRGTADVGHFVGQVQGLMTIATDDYIEGYGRITGGGNEAFFGGDSSGGSKQTSIIGFKL